MQNQLCNGLIPQTHKLSIKNKNDPTAHEFIKDFESLMVGGYTEYCPNHRTAKIRAWVHTQVWVLAQDNTVVITFILGFQRGHWDTSLILIE